MIRFDVCGTGPDRYVAQMISASVVAAIAIINTSGALMPMSTTTMNTSTAEIKSKSAMRFVVLLFSGQSH